MWALSHSGEKFPVVNKLILPITVTPGQAALGTAATDVEPPNIVAVLIHGYSDSNLKRILAANAVVVLHICFGQVLVAVSNWVLVSAGNADSYGCALRSRPSVGET